MRPNPTIISVIAALLVVIAVISSAYFLLQRTDVTVSSLLRPSSEARLLISMDGFHFTQAEGGDISWRMNARKADLYENKEAILKEIEIVFTNTGKEKKQATLLGELGNVNTENGNASVRGETHEVRVATSDGYLLATDSLSWRANERLVRTADPFTLIGKEIYLEGTGITANVDLRTILVKDNVKAVLQE